MPVRSEVDSTTTSGGSTTVDGTVADDGPGGPKGYLCDVLMLIDGDKLQYVGPSTPAAYLYKEDTTGIYVWWRNVPVTKAGVKFQVPVKWKAGAKGLALASIVSTEPAKKLISQDLVWLHKAKKSKVKKPKPPGKKLGKKVAKKASRKAGRKSGARR